MVTDTQKPFFDAFPPVATTYLDALLGAVDSFYSFARDVLGLTSEEETFTMPFIVSGVGSVYWTDAEGVRQVAQGNFLFSSAVDVGQTVFSAGGYTVSVVSGTGENVAGGGVTYFSSGSDVYWLTVPSIKAMAQSWDGGAQGFTGQSTAGGQAYAHRSTRPSFAYGQTPISLPFPQPAFKLETSVYSSLRGDTTAKILLPASDRQVTLADVKIQMVDSYNITYPEATIPYDDIPDFDEWQEQQATEDPTEPTTDANGSIIINNYDNTVMNVDNTINGNADIDVNGSVDITAEAGAFGAGAFGAGAFGYADIDLNLDGDFALNLDGSLDVAEITLNGNATSYTVDSGATLTVNNYVIESGASIELPSYPAIDFTLDYDEILSEQELESILSQENYEIETVANEVLSLELETFPEIAPIPEKILSVSATTLQQSSDFLDDTGLSVVYAPLSVILIACFILRGGK